MDTNIKNKENLRKKRNLIKYQNINNQNLMFLNTLSEFKNLNFNESLIFIPATLDEYYSLEEIKADYYEGNIVMNSPASYKHESIFMKISNKIFNFVEKNKIGEVLGSRFTIILGNHHFEPDITFINKNNPGKFTENNFIGIPDLIIEIISKSTKKYDLVNKREVYREYKVKEIWFVDYSDEKLIIDYLENDNYITKELGIKEKIESRVLKRFHQSIII